MDDVLSTVIFSAQASVIDVVCDGFRVIPLESVREPGPPRINHVIEGITKTR